METTTSADGTTIAFDRYGPAPGSENPAVVLVGGAIQHRAFDPPTARLATLLGERFTVVHYDRRGRGDSTDTQPYAPERELEDLTAVIDAVGGSAAVFAMSSGGALALDAVRAGLPITSLALYEPPFVVDDGRAPVPPGYRETLAAAEPGDAVAYFLTTGVGLPSETVDGMRAAPVWPVFESIAPTLAYDAAFVAEHMRGAPESLERWSDVAVRTLVLDGGDSEPFQHAAVDLLAKVLPNAARQTLAGQTHDVDPEVLAPVLIAHLTGETR
jgi:pimeloyl-ACP methyl ester carboxylesterase